MQAYGCLDRYVVMQDVFEHLQGAPGLLAGRQSTGAAANELLPVPQADEAARRYDAAVAAGAPEAAVRPRFAASDLQAVTGRFHTVACIDVLIHYPQARLPSLAFNYC